MSVNARNGSTSLLSGSFPPVRAASTGSPLVPATGGLLTVDGIALVAGDRVLVKDETSSVNNGIYAAATGPWVRTSDASGNQNFFSGMAVTVALGAVNGGLTYLCTCTDDPIVVGTSLLTFAAQSTVATATQTATSATSVTVDTSIAAGGSAAPWVDFTASVTLTPGSGAFSSTAVNRARYMQIGKIVFYYIDVSIVTNGSAGTYIGVNLPVTPAVAVVVGNMNGYDSATGDWCGAYVLGTGSGAFARFTNYSSAYSFTNGSRLTAAGFYEAA